MVAPVVLVFSSVKTAEYLVAGIPAAARALREVAAAFAGRDRAGRCVFVVAGGWTPSPWCRAELARLAPNMDWEVGDGLDGAVVLRGEALVSADTIAAAWADSAAPPPDVFRSLAEASAAGLTPMQWRTSLKRRSDAIVAETGKPGDGIVSQYLNRPVSQAISRILLRIAGVKPVHATFGTMALGLAMAAALFFGGKPGLIGGALLFQAASIFDGVDGEIARATDRTSRAGALLDSVTDALTNLAFIAGLAVNLWLRGDTAAASAGAAGMTMLAAGLYLIGRRTRANGGPFTFDLIKHHFRGGNSRIMQWLTYIAMRDFFALALALLILFGLAPHALIAFSVIVAGWLAVTVRILLSTGGTARGARSG